MTSFDQIMEIALNIAVYEQNFKLNFISDCLFLLILLNHDGFNRLYERFVANNMNLEDDAPIAMRLFGEFSNAAAELSPLTSSSAFLQMLLSLRRELSVLMNTPVEDTSEMIV